MAEVPIPFECAGTTLVGIAHLPNRAASCGVLILVGGPQYRIGSHRQFVLLARELAARGVAVFRFDYRSMGDSAGAPTTFEDISLDIEAAISAFFSVAPDLQQLVIWGLCDAASAALFYAHSDTRIRGLVLLNPWVRTEDGLARAYLRHYYLDRLRQPEFWKKLLSGAGSIRAMLGSLRDNIDRSRGATGAHSGAITDVTIRSLPDRMADGFERFRGKVLLILSGNNDVVAQEFKHLGVTSKRWRKLLCRTSVQRRDLPYANHTFSRKDWRNEVTMLTYEWVVGNFDADCGTPSLNHEARPNAQGMGPAGRAGL